MLRHHVQLPTTFLRSVEYLVGIIRYNRFFVVSRGRLLPLPWDNCRTRCTLFYWHGAWDLLMQGPIFYVLLEMIAQYFTDSVDFLSHTNLYRWPHQNRTIQLQLSKRELNIPLQPVLGSHGQKFWNITHPLCERFLSHHRYCLQPR